MILCERGIRTFETAMRNTFDVAAIALLKHDLSPARHRRPQSRGRTHANWFRRSPASRGRGADGLLVEVHPNPDKAWSDGEQSLDFAGFDAMMDGLSPWLAARTQQLERRDAPGARPMEAVG